MAVLGDLRVRSHLVIPAAELREAATRSRGPGGQNVNKTSTRVTIRWNLDSSDALSATQRRRLRAQLGTRITRTGDVVVHCDQTRSQARNRELARERLAEIVSGALVRPKPRQATKPSRSARAKRVDAKTRRGAVKQTRRPPGRDGD